MCIRDRTIEVTAAGETNTYTFGASNTMTGDLYVRKNNSDVIYTCLLYTS